MSLYKPSDVSYKDHYKAKKSKIDEYKVYQHNELIEATYKMSLGTKRLMLMMIALVDPIKGIKSNQMIKIHAKDYAKTCGISDNLSYRNLIKAVKELVGAQIHLYDPKKKKGSIFVISGKANYDDGAGFIECSFYPKILPLIQKFKGNFTQFKLAESIQFKRFYTIRIYELLMSKDNDKMGRKIKLSIDELRIILKVKHLETYNNFAQLNNKIIKPSIKEIEKKTDLKIKVELQRFGRRISHIIFEFERDEQKDMFK
jgi:plasmid replication initiation protein